MLQRQKEVATLQSRARDLEGGNVQLTQRLEEQEKTLGQQLANLQDRAQEVLWPPCPPCPCATEKRTCIPAELCVGMQRRHGHRVVPLTDRGRMSC